METALFCIAIVIFIIFAVVAFVVIAICLTMPKEYDWSSEVDMTEYPEEEVER